MTATSSHYNQEPRWEINEAFFPSRVKMTRVPALPDAKLYVDLYSRRNSPLLVPRALRMAPPVLSGYKYVFIPTKDCSMAAEYHGLYVQIPILPPECRLTIEEFSLSVPYLVEKITGKAGGQWDWRQNQALVAALVEAATGFTDSLESLSANPRSKAKRPGNALILAHIGGASARGTVFSSSNFFEEAFPANEFYTLMSYRESVLVEPAEMSGEFTTSNPTRMPTPKTTFEAANQWKRHELVAGLNDGFPVTARWFVAFGWSRPPGVPSVQKSMGEVAETIAAYATYQSMGQAPPIVFNTDIHTYRALMNGNGNLDRDLWEDGTHASMGGIYRNYSPDAVWCLPIQS